MDKPKQTEPTPKKTHVSRRLIRSFLPIQIGIFPIFSLNHYQLVRCNPKQLWLITFGSCSVDLTIDMLDELKERVNEIHNVTWRESKYVLLCLDRKGRMRTSQMQKIVADLVRKYGIVSSSIMGYESITGNGFKNEEIKQHPGFRHMVEYLQEGKKDQVRSWTSEKSKGVLQRYVGTTDIELMSKQQLLQTCRKWATIVNDAEPFRATFDAVQNELAATEGQLLSKRRHVVYLTNALRTSMETLAREGIAPSAALCLELMECGCDEMILFTP